MLLCMFLLSINSFNLTPLIRYLTKNQVIKFKNSEFMKLKISEFKKVQNVN